MPRTVPQPGDVVDVGPRASVQFCDQSAITFRVIRVDDRPTHGWCWLDGYELDRLGAAVERRSIFVQPDGLIPIDPSPRRPPRQPPSTVLGRGVVDQRWARR